MTHSPGFYIWIVLQVIIGYNLVVPVILYLFTCFKRKQNAEAKIPAEADYAIIVTAYEQITHLQSVVRSILKMRYKNYIVYVVADNCDVSKLNFKDERVVLLSPEEPLMSNVRSHFYAINSFVRNHERLTIIDSDNLVHPNYLNELNTCFEQGYLAVQGSRMARNMDTTFACLDAARDIYYHFYDGKILFELGSSATLAGSGMAFQTNLYVQCLENHVGLNGAGFDKVLQAEIVKRDFQIAFAEKAIVYDSKTTHSAQLVNQRARWINTWFRYFKFGFTLIKDGVVNSSFNQFLFGFILLRPPLFMFLILSVVCLFVNTAISVLYVYLWAGGLTIFTVGFFIALAKSNTSREIYRSLGKIPLFVYYQVISVFKIRDMKKNIATRHFNATVDNLNKPSL